MKNLVAAICILPVFGAFASAQDTPPKYLQDVFTRLLATTEARQHPAYFGAWPPVFSLVKSDEPNAAAGIANPRNCQPGVMVTSALEEKILQGDADRAAFVLGHEMSHLLLQHVQCSQENNVRSILEKAVWSRNKEYAADLNGMKLALEAGFSPNGVDAYKQLDALMPGGSFEALAQDHPATTDRLARLDSAHEVLWRSTAAFENGAYFLISEHYSLAENAFDRVAKEFPDSYEAWNNLGYARLMEYADQLSPEDVRALRVNAIVAGGFYTRPESILHGARGRDPQLWASAVAALKMAERLKPDSANVQANLGVAYLIKPEGSDPVSAVERLEKAVALAKADHSTTPLQAASYGVNLAAAYSATGNAGKATALLQQLDQEIGAQAQDDPAIAQVVEPAFLYNSGMSLVATSAASDRQTAFNLIQKYLASSSPASAWWPLAYERYKALAAEMRVSARTKDELQSLSGYSLRPAASVTLANGTVVQLGGRLADLQPKIGASTETSVSEQLERNSFPQYGMDLITTDNIVAIVLNTPAAPPLVLHEAGLGGRPVTLKVGMPLTDFDSVLKPAIASKFGFTKLLSGEDKFYRFYVPLGIAVRVGDDNTIREIVLVQVPRG